jgi:hypothetical protein
MARPKILGPASLPSRGIAEKDVSGSFAGTGSSASVKSRGVDVSIGGTFVGTAIIERLIGGVWQGIEAVTAPAERFIENDKSRGVRVRCSAFTSGPITYVLEG